MASAPLSYNDIFEPRNIFVLSKNMKWGYLENLDFLQNGPRFLKSGPTCYFVSLSHPFSALLWAKMVIYYFAFESPFPEV